MIASIVNIDGHELWDRPPKTPFQELGGEHYGVVKVWRFWIYDKGCKGNSPKI
jgi:hypothetical protein